MEGVGFETTSTSTSSGGGGGGGGGGGEHDDKSTVVPLPTLDVVKTTKINSTTMTSSSSSSLKKSGASGGRRSVQKRVVSVPIAEVDGSRPKGAGEGAPPSDSWAWRKYGQKPIKGSPYPRGYYRCSSSKGCPARKQVERSRVDPTMLVVTYAAEHNHPWPLPKSHNHQSHHHHHNNRYQNRHSGQTPRLPPRISTQLRPPREPEEEVDEDEEEEEMEEEEYQAPSPTPATTTTTNTSTSSLEDTNTTAATFASDLGEDSSHLMLMTEDLGWHSYMSEVSLPSEVGMMVPVSYDEVSKDLGFGSGGGGGGGGGEEESLFAGLGELPECSVVFRRGFSVGAS